MRNERKTVHLQMFLTLKKFKKHLTKLINAVFFHFLILLSQTAETCVFA